MGALIRDMTKEDIDRVGEILYEAFTAAPSKYGYEPIMQSPQEGKTWAWAMYHYGSSEGIVAVEHDRVIGVIFINRRDNSGGAGPCAVDPSCQGKAVASMLMDALMTRAEGLSSLRAVQEAFNPASFRLQYAFNLMPVADLMDLVLNGTAKERLEPHDKVSELTAEDLDAICEYDAPRSRFDRRKDLAYYARWGKVFVYRDQSRIRGYLACLPGARSVQLGPLLAEGEDEAECLFRHALTVFEGKPCRTRVMARDHLFVKGLLKLGFQLYCLAFLTVKGTWRPGRYIEAFGRFPEGI